VTTPGDTTPVSTTASPVEPTTVKDGKKVHYLTTDQFGKLKEQARSKGRAEALAEFAKQAGYASVEEMQAAIKSAGKPTTLHTDPQTKPDAIPKVNGKPDRHANDRQVRESARLQRELDQLRQRARSESDGRKDAERKAAALEAEIVLRTQAAQVGVRDIDYALHLLAHHVRGMDPELLKKFDETEYFRGLKQTAPHVFNEVTLPLTTGTGVGGAPTPPSTAAATITGAGAGKVDVRKMTTEEYNRYLAVRGLQHPGI
jgi:hypothetical protein